MKRAFILLLKILAGLLVFLLIACRLAASRWKGVGCPSLQSGTDGERFHGRD